MESCGACGLALAYGRDPLQQVELFLPRARRFPVVVCVYGSYWHFAYDDRWRPIGELLRDRGFGAVVVRHRLWPPDRWPAQIEDVAAALAWIEANAGTFGGRSDGVALLGHSSGAQLALLLALDRSHLDERGVTPGFVRAVATLGPVTDLVPRGDGSGFGDEVERCAAAEIFSRDPNLLRAASPFAHVRRDMPPVQLVIGERELPGIAKDAERFHAECRGAGARASVVRAPGRNHMELLTALVDDAALQRTVLGFLEESFR